MRNYRIYLYTTLGFVLVYILLALLVFIPITVKFNSTALLQNKIDSATLEIKQVSVLSAGASENNLSKKLIIDNIQKAISGSIHESVFLSVIDWSGKIVCYPDVTKVGGENKQKSNTISNMGSVLTGEELYDHIIQREDENEAVSEIIALKPIANLDLIIAAHLNVKNSKFQIGSFKRQAQMMFLVLGLILLLFLLIVIRILSIYYERIIDSKTAKLEDGVLNLSKLNTSLENYQKSIAELQSNTESVEKQTEEKSKEEDLKEIPKQRLLTYIRNELMPIAIEDISYIYVENSISYVVRKDGKRYTANDSLDQIYATLDPKLFFRANRQTIVAIYAIDKIIKYGNSALKIEMQPVSEIDIVIGKNKVAVFKKWLDM